MNAAGRLGLYAAGLAVAFGAAYGIAAVVVPDGVAAAWNEETDTMEHSEAAGTADHAETDATDHAAASHAPAGLSLSAGGYVLSPVSAPVAAGAAGELSFRILSSDGEPLTEFTTAHEKDLHLIVVRSDGAGFRHVHPVLDESTGTWSLPWEWHEAGSHRVYADFTPGGADDTVTLSRTVPVSGGFAPVTPEPSSVASVDGYTVSIAGDLVAGSASELTVSIHRDGEPVTELQPYLGAFGHLVALRDGDLAYLHVHAAGHDPEPGATSGPDISFMAEAPTAGRYLLYLDFQIDGQVHTAPFVLDTAGGTP